MTNEPQTIMAELGLEVESVFVPWSKSRFFKADTKDPRERSLNWRVTLKRGGREIISTDYTAGLGHCPAYQKLKRGFISLYDEAGIIHETEKGTIWIDNEFRKGKPILPDSASVLHSLLMDSDAIDCSTFEEWAENSGYDVDSRKAEAIYRQCLEIGLKLRNGLGDGNLTRLREAFQDY